MEFSELLNKYLAAIDEILVSVGSSEDKNQTKVNMINAAYLNFTAIAAENPNIKPLLAGSTEDYSSIEEFQKKTEEIKSVFEKNGINFITNFKDAMKQTLNDFISEFELKLAPEKVIELQKIVSEDL